MTTRTSLRRKGAAGALAGTALLAATVVVAPGAAAADASWDGDGGDSNWSTAANWSAAPPGAGELATFPDGPANKTVVVDAGSGADLDFTGAGYELELGVLTAFGDITATGAGTNTIDLHAEMSGSQVTVGAGSTLVFAERVELEDGPMTIDGAGNVEIPGGAVALIRDNDVVLDGPGALLLNGDNFGSWTGDLVVNGGNGVVASALGGSSDIEVNGGTVEVAAVVGGGVAQTAGTVDLLGPSAVVQGPSTVGGGTFVIEDVASANGGITQDAGTVHCDNDIVGIGAGYSGTLDAQLSVGNGPDDIGGCGVVGGFTLTGPGFNDAGSLHLDIDGSVPTISHDRIDVTGAVTVDFASLTIDVDATVPGGTELVLIDNDGADAVVGTFAGHPEGIRILFGGTGQTFELSYVGGDGNDVTFTAVPQLVVTPSAIAEGGPGDTTDAGFTFSLDGPAVGPVTFDVDTAAVTATAGLDFTAVSLDEVTIPDGETFVNVEVPVLGDALDEANETYQLVASNVAGFVSGTPTGTGTIVDDDGAPVISVGDPTVLEGDDTDPVAMVPVSLDAPSGQDVTFLLATANGSATAPDDYTPLAAGFVIDAGQTEVLVPITVQGDTLDEVDESFAVALDGITNAVAGDVDGTVTIDDDDGPVVSVTDETALESVDAEFFVTLSAPSPQDVSVDYQVVPGTATAADVVLDSGTLTIPAGEVEALLVVDLLPDSLDEADETFTVVLSSPVDGEVAAAAADVLAAAGTTGNGVITDDDPAPSLSVLDASVTEGTGGTRSVPLTVSLSAVSGQDVSVTVSTSVGSAGPADFTAVATNVTIPAGSTSATVAVPINTDALAEGNETFSVELTAPVNAGLADPSATVSIVDDDTAVGGGDLPRTGVAALGALLTIGGLLLAVGGGALVPLGRVRRAARRRAT